MNIIGSNINKATKDWTAPVTIKKKQRSIQQMVQEDFGHMTKEERLDARYELRKLISNLQAVADKLK